MATSTIKFEKGVKVVDKRNSSYIVLCDGKNPVQGSFSGMCIASANSDDIGDYDDGFSTDDSHFALYTGNTTGTKIIKVNVFTVDALSDIAFKYAHQTYNFLMDIQSSEQSFRQHCTENNKLFFFNGELCSTQFVAENNFGNPIATLMLWQGDLKVDMMTAGADEQSASNIAADYIDKLMKSKIIDVDAKKVIDEYINAG